MRSLPFTIMTIYQQAISPHSPNAPRPNQYPIDHWHRELHLDLWHAEYIASLGHTLPRPLSQQDAIHNTSSHHIIFITSHQSIPVRRHALAISRVAIAGKATFRLNTIHSGLHQRGISSHAARATDPQYTHHHHHHLTGQHHHHLTYICA